MREEWLLIGAGWDGEMGRFPGGLWLFVGFLEIRYRWG